jgi:CheY-like chemotaxis protein
MAIKKILLVDDSKTELHFLSELLTKRGYSVRTAEDGEDAMRRLGEDKPDLILMDVVMPGQNGFQLTRAITRDPRFRSGACARAHATTSSSPSMPTSWWPRSRRSTESRFGLRTAYANPPPNPPRSAGRCEWPIRKHYANCKAASPNG